MAPRLTHLRRSLTALFLALSGTLVIVMADQHAAPQNLRAEAQGVRSSVSMLKVAKSMDAAELSRVIEERKELLTHSVTVSFIAGTGSVVTRHTLALSEHPSWIVFEVDMTGHGRAAVSLDRLTQELIAYPIEGIAKPQSCSILSTYTDDEGVIRAQTDCVAKSGYSYDTPALAKEIAAALETGISDISFRLTEEPARISDASGYAEGAEFSLLSTGESDFHGSGAGRKANVRKAINERVNNIIVPKDATFSFNDTLGTVSTSKGWAMALTIFEGANLRPAPGGGICQASTTTYRAALKAGLPIVEQKNHSLYVTYYEAHGVGQDATIFPGQQDLKFVNDTGGPILIQSYSVGDEAYVNFYGTDDGRAVVMSGPYFSSTIPEGVLEAGKKLRKADIAWTRSVQRVGAETTNEVIVAKYKAIPKSLPTRVEATTKVVRGNMETALATTSVVAAD